MSDYYYQRKLLYFASIMTNFVGQSLQNGKYFLQKEVGRGSFGIIYQAIDSIFKQRVAIKILDRSLRQHPKFAHRFDLQTTSSD
jgi:serine/threonine protein kinase